MSEFMAVFLCLVVRFSFHFPVWFQLDWGHETLKQPEVFCSIFPSKKKKNMPHFIYLSVLILFVYCL